MLGRLEGLLLEEIYLVRCSVLLQDCWKVWTKAASTDSFDVGRKVGSFEGEGEGLKLGISKWLLDGDELGDRVGPLEGKREDL